VSDAFPSSVLRSELADLAAYEPLHGDYPVRLDANEAPAAVLSDGAREVLAQAMASVEPTRYPDARMTALRAAIGERMGVAPERVVAGCGSDEIIALLLTAIDHVRPGSRHKTIVTTSPTFVMYRISARARGMQVVEVPLDRSWDLDVGSMLRAIELMKPLAVFVATPNNPTGNLASLDRLRAIIDAATDCLVVVDEAYVDYAPRAQLELLERPNVAVMRTLSKVGFAALRVGWLVGAEELVTAVDKVRQPFNMAAPVQAAAVAVLRELGHEIDRVRDVVSAERRRVGDALVALGFEPAPSDANFLWVTCPGPADEVAAPLARRGVLVKSFQARGGRLTRRLRITVGAPRENDRLLEELAACC
jgi:histidinol-phosphate aminotransferase